MDEEQVSYSRKSIADIAKEAKVSEVSIYASIKKYKLKR